MRIEGTLKKIIFNVSSKDKELLLANVHIRDSEDFTLKISGNNSNNSSIKLNLNNAHLESITIGGEIAKEIFKKADLGDKICLNLQLGQGIKINAILKSIEIESED